MEKLYGLWVDHEKAIIVSLIDGSHQVIHVESDIEGRIIVIFSIFLFVIYTITIFSHGLLFIIGIILFGYT
ncbi:unnamed protein product, partial [marine sediment metagenome]